MSCANSVASPCARSCARSVLARRGVGYPSSLALLWPAKITAAGVLKSANGPAPVFTDVPTVDAAGVTPGDGPSFSSVVTWSDGGTRVWEITMTTASADLVGDVEVGGGLSVNSSGLKFSDGANIATVETSWAAGEVVTVVVQVDDALGIRVGDGTTFGDYAPFDSTLPTLTLSPDCPGKLKQVQEWKKLASAREIGKY